ncbi:MAG: flavin monoamine oxidase family protein, partial [Alphaproteobacteria bacterium]
MSTSSKQSSSPLTRPHLSRRGFQIALGGALISAAAFARLGNATNPDVVIIGAGAAGIAAAHQCAKDGLSFVMVEAKGRVGGRAFTETDTFGVPYDHGAHWVQSENRNSYFKRAKQSGLDFYRARDQFTIFGESGRATSAEEDQLWTAWAQAEAGLDAAGASGRDISAADASRAVGDWANTAEFAMGPWEMGKDFEDFSALDWWESAGSTDWYCKEGYGTLVAAHAANIPVSLNTPVRKIDWSGRGVTVETDAGTISARAAIITVSTGVLAGEGIAFNPPLPVRKQESFNGISMGDYNHVTLQFSEDVFGAGIDGYVLHKVDQSREGFGGLTNASGLGLAYCDVGGQFALDLENAGEAESIDFVLGKLRSLIGSDVDKYFVKGSSTAWTTDPFVRGCYASARPGAYPMREVLREPIGDRLFFAGEACHEDLWATVGGADRSGT